MPHEVGHLILNLTLYVVNFVKYNCRPAYILNSNAIVLSDSIG